MIRRHVLAFFLLGTLTAVAAEAAIVLRGSSEVDRLGTFTLLEDTPEQIIEIYASSDAEPVQGLNLNVQIGDGGPEAGGIDGPSITTVDLFTGTIFEWNNTGLGSASGVLIPQIAFYSTTTASGTVPADGLLARITIDTTGFFSDDGPFDLVLSQTLNNPTNFGPVTPTIIDGFIELTGSLITGDFNSSGALDAGDLASLYDNLGNPDFDLTGDQQTDSEDVQAWVERLFGTRLGDSNLDGRVDLIDLSAVASGFGESVNGYELGDFNADRMIDLIDLSLLAESFGFDAAEVMPGDLDRDGRLDAFDIEILYENLGDPAFDLDGDGASTASDLAFWTVDLFGSRLGDSNLDSVVDLIDLSTLASNFGLTADAYADADFNGDRLVDLIDLSLLASSFGAPAAPVPEPSALNLLFLCFLRSGLRR
ncbi:hypothetical protein [Mucisphaera sp.]|uniref:hypothetical protein n=1 Tax=Mucisphaera sp. TaxID=2913024 RepID=UPI003D0BCA5B